MNSLLQDVGDQLLTGADIFPSLQGMFVHIVVESEGHNGAIHIFIVPLEEVLRALASNDCSYTIMVKGMAFWWPFKDL